MNPTFNTIVKAAIDREGGFVNDPDDPGGATNMGVTIGTLKAHGIDVNHDGVIDINDVRCLSYCEAKRMYREMYWNPGRAGELPDYMREIYFDMCINHGQANAIRIIQKAAQHKGLDVAIDGRIGPQTLSIAPHLQLDEVVLQRLLFYTDIQLHHPPQRKFARGWYHKRCLAFLTE